ncbi:Os11g0521332 [Oryza sativa Japonica Group]|jgi:hypothetical protein|uniref:Os11g0521332 protein n=1 Tax=Oryza sativa subsp. japonica TaxID=39947 RepID=A0A0P0Y2T3_ORYSJ|nr:Os11g0521332 [Oryza sativa Japonica Group]
MARWGRQLEQGTVAVGTRDRGGGLGGAKLEAWARGGEEGGARLRRKLVLMELEISADWALEVRHHLLAIVFILEIDAAPAHPGPDMGGRGEGGDKTLPQSY